MCCISELIDLFFSWRSLIIFAPVLGGVVVVGVIPLILATIMSYCVTGYIRDELYTLTVKRCIGLPCSLFVSQCISYVSHSAPFPLPFSPFR